MRICRLLTLLLTTVCACTYSDNGDFVDTERLTGRYVYQASGQLTIDVNSDGTYTNYTFWGKRKIENSGTWIYDSLNGRVKFEHFSFLTDTMDIGHSTFVPSGIWNTRIENKENEIRFIYATDIYKGYFLKVDSVDRKKQVE
jgi:hypothetical protein